MGQRVKPGDCVQLSDGRIGRVRDVAHGELRVRVRRTTSKTHQFLTVGLNDVAKVDCPKAWMSPEGYNRYLDTTLTKMRQRQRKSRPSKGRRSQ
jgi:hypothetical protein